MTETCFGMGMMRHLIVRLTEVKKIIHIANYTYCIYSGI